MNITETLDDLTEAARGTKHDLCEASGGPADPPPIIVGKDSKGVPFMMLDTLEGHPTDNLGFILNEIANKLDEKNETMRWEWLAYIVEGYAKRNPDENEAKNHERGTYERDFKNNPSSDVSEGIIITIFTWEGESVCRTQLYHYGDDGLPVWSESIDPEHAPEGLIPEIFHGFTIYCKHEGDVRAIMSGMN